MEKVVKEKDMKQVYLEEIQKRVEQMKQFLQKITE